MKYHKLIRHHGFRLLSKKERLCIAALIGMSFMRGMCIGIYLSDR